MSESYTDCESYCISSEYNPDWCNSDLHIESAGSNDAAHPDNNNADYDADNIEDRYTLDTP